MRYFLELSYRGTDYNGWQLQRNQSDKVTIQGKVNEALNTILHADGINCCGQGRTDSGVHAKIFYAHFDHQEEFPPDFVLRMNRFLPRDIVIHGIFEVKDNAHARFDATGRGYAYHIHLKKNAFLYDRSFFFPYGPVDMDLVRKATGLLINYKDFDPLSKRNPDLKTTICHISEAYWEIIEEGARLIFHISANRFLRNMVRRIVGALLAIGTGKLDMAAFDHAMKNGNALEINISVPPQGLYLKSVQYPYTLKTKMV